MPPKHLIPLGRGPRKPECGRRKSDGIASQEAKPVESTFLTGFILESRAQSNWGSSNKLYRIHLRIFPLSNRRFRLWSTDLLSYSWELRFWHPCTFGLWLWAAITRCSGENPGAENLRDDMKTWDEKLRKKAEQAISKISWSKNTAGFCIVTLTYNVKRQLHPLVLLSWHFSLQWDEIIDA